MNSKHPGLVPATVLVAGLVLAACQSAPPLQESSAWLDRQQQLLALDHWQLQGRVNARYQDDSHTPRIRWEQSAESYTIRLWGALNAGSTRIQGRPGQVTFEQGGELYSASSPEQLILEHLGYELPVSQLEFWIKGLPTPDERYELQLGDFNELVQLEQSGWSVRYDDYRLFGDYSLPRRIELSRAQDAIRLTFLGLSWTVGDAVN